jgi:hypothetical protein
MFCLDMWSSGCILGELLAHKPLLQVRYPQFPLRYPVLVVRYQYLFTYMVPIPINMHFVPFIFFSPFALQSLQPRSQSSGLYIFTAVSYSPLSFSSPLFHSPHVFSFFSNYSITLVRFAPLSLPSSHIPC